MKILVATEDFFSYIEYLFEGHEVELLSPEYDENTTADLLVFTGGEDVHPSFYDKPAPETGWFNTDRDKWELKVMADILAGTLKIPKVFGICRGLQLMNVALGGTLVYDIYRKYGKRHPNVHPVLWMDDSISRSLRAFFPEVNSLHHQAIEKTGDKVRPMTLAFEPETALTEAILWGDKFLAVQFHPELMDKSPATEGFVQWIEKWVQKSSAPSSGRKSVKEKISHLEGYYASIFNSTYNPDNF